MTRESIGYKKYIGRDYEKYNCFDLVKEFYMDFFKIDIRHYFEGSVVPDRNTVSTLITSNKGDFVAVSGPPQFGDIVVIKLFGIECHIGVCIGPLQFLHSGKNIGSHLERIERYQKLIAGFYRHRTTP